VKLDVQISTINPPIQSQSIGIIPPSVNIFNDDDGDDGDDGNDSNSDDFSQNRSNTPNLTNPIRKPRVGVNTGFKLNIRSKPVPPTDQKTNIVPIPSTENIVAAPSSLNVLDKIEETTEVLSLAELLELEEKNELLRKEQQTKQNDGATINNDYGNRYNSIEQAEIDAQREAKLQKKEYYRQKAKEQAEKEEKHPKNINISNPPQNDQDDFPSGDGIYTFYVGGLGKDVTVDMLEKLFRDRYPQSFLKGKIVYDQFNETRGYGFVCFNNPLDMAKAFVAMNGSFCGERRIFIKKDQRDEKQTHRGHGSGNTLQQKTRKR